MKIKLNILLIFILLPTTSFANSDYEDIYYACMKNRNKNSGSVEEASQMCACTSNMIVNDPNFEKMYAKKPGFKEEAINKIKNEWDGGVDVTKGNVKLEDHQAVLLGASLHCVKQLMSQ